MPSPSFFFSSPVLYHNFVSILPLIVHRSADMFSLPSVLGWSFDSFRFNESFIHEVCFFYPPYRRNPQLMLPISSITLTHPNL